MSEGHTERLEAALDGKYLIERKLGEGGMATVYLAQDVKHERKVALKILKPELAAVIGAERFLSEIKTTAGLQHPHILALHDSGDAGGYLYYVMPYIEGETLRDKLDREKQLGVEESVRIARDVADALDYAHQQGVIHRDIKPANILLHAGRPVVADFGIALAVSAAGGGRMTETGLSLGTPHYMSPEQASADRDLSARSDVYSLGCVLYEMIGGQPPHSGPSAQSILVHILTKDATPLTELRHTVPPHVAATVSKAIEKLPADRFETAKQFMEALGDEGFSYRTRPRESVVARESGGPRAASFPARPWHRDPRSLIAAMAVALAAWGWLRPSPTEGPARRLARFSVPAPEGVTDVAVPWGPAQTLSPDGEWLVYTAATSSGPDALYRRRLGQLEAEEIPGTSGASSPFFSPDGLFVGFHSEGRIRRVAMAGGSPVPITEIERIDGGSWGDNGVIVFTTVGQEGANLFTVPAVGGVATPVPIEGEERRMYPWMLPGGEAALARVSTRSDSPIVAIDLATGREDTLGVATRVAYASGYLVTYSGGTLLAQPFDPQARATTGPAVAILDGVRASGPGVGNYALSAEGTLVYVMDTGGDRDESLVIQSTGVGEVVPLTTTGDLEEIALSPDGRRIAFRLGANMSQGSIWLWDRDQRTQQLLVEDASDPTWSPDGARIAFRSLDTGSAIHVIPADASQGAVPLLVTEFLVRPSSWTPDGLAVAFEGLTELRGDGTGRDWEVGLVTASNGDIRWLPGGPSSERAPRVSPDGRWLAYISDRSGDWEVYVRALDGSGGLTQISAGGGYAPRWAPSGAAIYYVTGVLAPIVEATLSFEDGVRVLERTERPAGITDAQGSAARWDVGPDGEEIVYVGSAAAAGGESSAGPTMVWVLNWQEIVRELTGSQ